MPRKANYSGANARWLKGGVDTIDKHIDKKLNTTTLPGESSVEEKSDCSKEVQSEMVNSGSNLTKGEAGLAKGYRKGDTEGNWL